MPTSVSKEESGAMANQNSAKGNPASKRMGNPKLKARRAASWLRGEQRKAVRVETQDAAARGNEKLRQYGLPTPNDLRKARQRKAQ